MHWIDFRSDTVSRPTLAMREVMLHAEVGDDVYGDDPTVNHLQERLANDLGFEAGLFVPSGTQSNLLALMSHCQRGDEYIVGMEAHTYKFEGGGAAVLGSIQPQPIPQADDGTLPLDAVERAIKPIDPHYARTKLLCLENTWRGQPLALDYLHDARALCDRQYLLLHLDGARLYNAAIACKVPARDIAGYFDSVSVCFSKGLGAPVGSVLVGSKELIETARRWRKVAGGGWRQAGMLAAACIHALDHHVDRLADDHARAERLAEGLRDARGLKLLRQHTNMVFIDVPTDRLDAFKAHMNAARICMAIGYLPNIRMVTHLDIDDDGVDRAIAALRAFDA
jgi:threonine aldolase